MAEISFTIPDDQVARVIAALASRFQCDPTPAEVKAAIARTIRDWVRHEERKQAEQQAVEDFQAGYGDPGVT